MKRKELKEKKQNRGITLIALIITIIVLLILAGVTINLTLGENGIFKTAEMAGKNYTEAQDKELAGLAEFENTINDIIEENGNNTEVSIPQGIGEAINVGDYGKKVVGYSSKSSSGYTGDWRLFYQDAEYTYIIMDGVTEEYLPSDYYTTVTKEDGTLKYQTGADVGEVGQNLSSMLKTNATFFIENNKNENIRTTAWLTDTEYWADYTDEAENALFAIASPTVELYVASFNATAQTNGAEEITLGVGTYGYTHDATTYNQLSTSYNNGIYNYDGVNDCLLVSPDSRGAIYELVVSARYSYFVSGNVTIGSNPVRPVVCIPTSIFQTAYTLE